MTYKVAKSHRCSFKLTWFICYFLPLKMNFLLKLDWCIAIISYILQGCTNFKDLAIQDSNDLCDGLNIDDVPLNFENAEGIFSCPQGPSRYQFEDGEMDCLLMEKNLSVTESNGPNDNAVQVLAYLFSLEIISFIIWHL